MRLMPFNDLVLVWLNLTRKKLRLVLMVFAISIAFLLYGVIGSLTYALDSSEDLSAANRLTVLNKVNFTRSLPYAYFNQVRTVKGVKAVTHWNWFGGYFQDPKNGLTMFATNPEANLAVYPEIVLPSEQREAWFKNRQGLIVGKRTADTYGWEVGDRIAIRSNIFYQADGRDAWDFDVEGIYVGSDPQFPTEDVYFHYDYFNETKSSQFGKDTIGLMALLTDDASLNDRVVTDIDSRFANSFYETETIPEKAFIKGFLEQQGAVALIITSVIGAAFFVILIVVGNSMILAIRERVGEIAVFKTLGFSSPRIMLMVLLESLLLSMIGGGIGMAGAYSITVSAQSMLPGNLPIPVMTDKIVAQSVLYMIGLGLITGLAPAIQALRVNLLLAFRKL